MVILLNNTGSTNLGGMCRSITNILYDKPYSLPKKSLAEALGKTILESDVHTAIEQYQDLKENHSEF